jgi:hypothetical protein
LFKRIFIVFITLFLSVSTAHSGIIVLENLKNESVSLKATGEGVFPTDDSFSKPQKELMAKRAATVDAYRKLLEQIKEIRVDSKTHIEDFMTKSDTINTNINGYIQGAKIVDYRILNDSIAEVDVVLELGSKFYNMVKPHIIESSTNE